MYVDSMKSPQSFAPPLPADGRAPLFPRETSVQGPRGTPLCARSIEYGFLSISVWNRRFESKKLSKGRENLQAATWFRKSVVACGRSIIRSASTLWFSTGRTFAALWF